MLEFTCSIYFAWIQNDFETIWNENEVILSQCTWGGDIFRTEPWPRWIQQPWVDLRPGVALLANIQCNACRTQSDKLNPIWGPRVSDPRANVEQLIARMMSPNGRIPGTYIVYVLYGTRIRIRILYTRARHMLAYSLFMRLAYWQAGPNNCNEVQMVKLLFLSASVDVLWQMFPVKPLLLLLCERCANAAAVVVQTLCDDGCETFDSSSDGRRRKGCRRSS